MHAACSVFLQSKAATHTASLWIPPALYRVPTISNRQLTQVTSSNIGCSLGFQMTEELPVKLPVSPTLLHLLDFPFINLWSKLRGFGRHELIRKNDVRRGKAWTVAKETAEIWGAVQFGWRYSFFRVEEQVDSENKWHETEKGEEDWKYRRTKTTLCHYGFTKYQYQKQKQNSETLQGIECYLLNSRTWRWVQNSSSKRPFFPRRQGRTCESTRIFINTQLPDHQISQEHELGEEKFEYLPNYEASGTRRP
jgi:hypothetical protein